MPNKTIEAITTHSKKGSGSMYENILKMAKEYYPNFVPGDNTLEPIEWSKMCGTWYEVARTSNEFQNACGGSKLTLKPTLPRLDCATLCYKRTYYTGSEITHESEGTISPSTVFPMTASMRSEGNGHSFMEVPNILIYWRDEEYKSFILATPFGNVWIFSRCPKISDKHLSEIISNIPGNVAKCRMIKVKPLEKC